MSDFQIIRTPKEMWDADHNGIYLDSRGCLFTRDSGYEYMYFDVEDVSLPAVVVATAAQVRAAREALEEDDEHYS